MVGGTRLGKRWLAAAACVLLLTCPACTTDRRAAAREVDAQQRIHGWMEALPMPPDPSASPIPPSTRDPLLSVLAGRWEVTGRLDGRPANLDLVANWMEREIPLNVSIVSRAQMANLQPDYTVVAKFAPGADGKSFSAVWDETVGGVRRHLSGQGEKDEDRDRIAFTLTNADGSGLSFYFELDASDDSWTLYIDDKRKGWTERFASLQLHRSAAR